MDLVHNVKCYICYKCDHEFTSKDNIRKHIDESHKQDKDTVQEKFEALGIKFESLKENYERLSNINKKLQEQAKDKQYALDIQLEEIRTADEKAEAENIKLKDNLDTQNKLWKMWILKQEQCETEKSSVKLQEYKEKHKKPQNENANAITDEEILLVEDDDNVDEDSGNLDETEIIFQQFLKNQNEQVQTSQLEAENAPEKLSCRICNFKTNTKISLHQHVQSVHEINRRRVVQFCHFWNNFGTCNFEEKRGVPCKFEHKPAPTCNFDGECTRKRCMYSHKK